MLYNFSLWSSIRSPLHLQCSAFTPSSEVFNHFHEGAWEIPLSLLSVSSVCPLFSSNEQTSCFRSAAANNLNANELEEQEDVRAVLGSRVLKWAAASLFGTLDENGFGKHIDDGGGDDGGRATLVNSEWRARRL